MKSKNKVDTADFPLLTLIHTLTPKQREVLGQVMIGQDKGLPKHWLKYLEKKGLITAYEDNLNFNDGLPPLKVTRYCMDYHQNYAYCCWCEEQNLSEDE